MLDDFIFELADKGIKVYMISGNHDSQEKVQYMSRIAARSGIYISGTFSGKADRYSLEKDGQIVDVYLLPFIKPSLVRKKYPEAKIETYEDAVRCVIEHSDPSDNKRIMVAHQMVFSGTQMPELSESESYHIGGVEAVSASVFSGFDYVALGHIHSAMNMGSEKVRYCGAPLKYAVSEREKDKSVTILDVNDTVSWYTVPLKPLRDVRFVRGTMEELLEMGKRDEDSDDFVFAWVEGDAVNPMPILREVYPNIVGMDTVKEGQSGGALPIPADLDDLDAMEEFEKFFRSKTGEDLTESQRKIIQDLFEAHGVVL